jgi:Tol biopolymer transport system component
MVPQDSIFRLTMFDSSCRKVSECTMPAFTRYPGAKYQYALSRDGSRLVYRKDDTHNLYLFDIAAQKETLLWEGMVCSETECPYKTECQYIAWISDSNIVVVLHEYPGSDRRNAVVVLDISSGERRTIYEPTYPSSIDHSLSPDGSLLAFEDGNKLHDIYGVIKILDLRSGTVRATLGSGKDLIGCPFWNPEGTELVYVEGQELKVWGIADNETRTLRTFPDEFICYYVVFGAGMVGYVGSKSDWGSPPLAILDSRDGKELRTIRAPFNGGMFLLNGNTVVCEIGY